MRHRASALPPAPAGAGAKAKRRSAARRFLVRAAGILAGFALLGWVGFFAAVAWLPYPAASDRAVETSIRILDRNEVPLAALVSRDGQWHIPLTEQEIHPRLLQAIVAVEDSRFYQHHGVDWKSVAGAAWQDTVHLGARRGASTLTMQLQRLRDPQPRTLGGKIEQAIRAAQLEKRLGKSQILLEYVNRAPFGGNLVGAGAASWRYFGRPCRQLSLGEVALLAGLPQSPNRLRPDRYPSRAIARRNHVLDRMLACGFITARDRDEAAAEPVTASWRPLPQDRNADDLPAADGALPTLLRVSAARSLPMVRSTLDATIQRQVAQVAQEHLLSLEGAGVSCAAVVVLDTRTSQCLAAVSLGANDLRIDLTNSRRSTGSTLKPFIYGAAFDAGLYGPRSVLSDTPAAWPGYKPSDYDRSFRGKLSAAEALAESRNIPAMLVLSKIGVQSALGVMDAAGLHALAKFPGRYGLSLAIGGAEASPMELAGAYAALARGGTTAAVQLRCDRPSGAGSRCLRPMACWQVLSALSETSRTSGVCPEAARSHVAWKTGTSSGHRDAWCAAVTHRRTVVVWMGNANGGSSAALVGQEAAAPLALQLVAMLDPQDEPWPQVNDNVGPGRQGDIHGSSLVMVRPSEGEQFVLTSDMPRDRQQVLLEAAGRGEQAAVWWFVDGRPFGTDAERLWWQPVAGNHEIRVVDANGHSAIAHVNVRQLVR